VGGKHLSAQSYKANIPDRAAASLQASYHEADRSRRGQENALRERKKGPQWQEKTRQDKEDVAIQVLKLDA
jgi:hypothetical protein